MLGYETVQLDPSLCYVHCLPALRNAFEELIRQNPEMNCAGYSFRAGGIFCEPFSQMEAYGNGLDYVLIVPDQASGRLNVVYSLWALSLIHIFWMLICPVRTDTASAPEYAPFPIPPSCFSPDAVHRWMSFRR